MKRWRLLLWLAAAVAIILLINYSSPVLYYPLRVLEFLGVIVSFLEGYQLLFKLTAQEGGERSVTMKRWRWLLWLSIAVTIVLSFYYPLPVLGLIGILLSVEESYDHFFKPNPPIRLGLADHLPSGTREIRTREN